MSYVDENMKVEIKLSDLNSLYEFAGFYENAAKERDTLSKENQELKKKIEELEKR